MAAAASQQRHGPRSSGPATQMYTTTTQVQVQTRTQADTQTTSPPVLRLRGAHRPSQRAVRWSENVVDNEGLGRKKSKVCCIYHRPRGVDESSDESSDSSSSSSSDDESDAGNRRSPSRDTNRSHKGKRRSHHDDHDGHRRHHHNHDDDDDNDDEDDHEHADKPARRRAPDNCGSDERPARRPSPNAYERVPKPRTRVQEPGASNSAGGSTMNK